MCFYCQASNIIYSRTRRNTAARHHHDVIRHDVIRDIVKHRGDVANFTFCVWNRTCETLDNGSRIEQYKCSVRPELKAALNETIFRHYDCDQIYYKLSTHGNNTPTRPTLENNTTVSVVDHTCTNSKTFAGCVFRRPAHSSNFSPAWLNR